MQALSFKFQDSWGQDAGWRPPLRAFLQAVSDLATLPLWTGGTTTAGAGTGEGPRPLHRRPLPREGLTTGTGFQLMMRAPQGGYGGWAGGCQATHRRHRPGAGARMGSPLALRTRETVTWGLHSGGHRLCVFVRVSKSAEH